MTEETIYELIAAYLAGETEKEQNERLYEWIGQSYDNRYLFETLRMAWGASLADYGQMTKSKELILGKALANTRRRRILNPVLSAACLIGALSLGFLASLIINKEATTEPVTLAPAGEVTLTTLPGQKAEATLPDGTKVWLNSGTTISYPAAYGIEGRIARLLEGEVYLNVAKDEARPFILDTRNGFVKVHGTSFDVRNYDGDQSMSVSLEEGSIEYFASENSATTMIVPGQRLNLDKETGSMILQRCDVGVESIWRLGEMKIEKMDFMSMMADMERWYGVDITISGNIPKDSYYWMTIKTESLREMLGLLRKITPLSYRIDGKDVLINVK